MAPTEITILVNYLLVPAQLPAIISLKEFTELFPRPQQSSPQIRKLYRDLQAQRNEIIDHVASNIEDEAKRGKEMRREIRRSKRDAENPEYDDEVDIERALYGAAAGARKLKHNITSIVPELDLSVEELEATIESLEREEADLLQDIKQTVGGMSDLRYGRFSNSQLGQQVIDGLHAVQETCESKR
ncbi:hypothetical protein N0V82_005888 [Gnomoniopsis sp. IMI 355080]|nr:hypothetical protein N0V82_005888 [Gnomoniopsis sp. IMI 355080]